MLKEERPSPYDQELNVSPTKGLTIEELTKEPYKINYLYHITHIDNLSSIFKRGLLSHRRAHGELLVTEDIANQEVIRIRERTRIPLSGRMIVDYVPLFFTPRNPMMYVKKDIHDDIAVLCLDRNLLSQSKEGVIFTDGNAADNETAFFNDLRFIDRLDWICIRDGGKPIHLYGQQAFEEWKRKRAAEVLVPDWISFSHVQSIVVKTHQTHRKLPNPVRGIAKIDRRFYLDSDLRFHFDN